MDRKIIMSKLIILLLLIYSCSNQIQIDDEVKIYLIDPYEVEDNPDISNFVETADLVFLETNEESLIGGIDKVEIYKNRLFVLDSWKGKSLLMFDLQGSFISRIGNIGSGPGEFECPDDFYIDTIKESIVVLDVYKVIYYDMNGRYLSEQRIGDFIPSKMIPLNNNMAFRSGGVDDLLIYSDSNLNRISSYFPYTIRTFNVHILNPLQTYTNNTALLRKFMVDTIYLLDDEGISPHCIFSFGENTLTRPKYLEIGKQGGGAIHEKLSESNYCDLFGYFETINHVFLMYSKTGKRYFTLISKETDNNLTVQYKKYINPYTFEAVSFMYPKGKTTNQFIFEVLPHLLVEGKNQFLSENESINVDSETLQKMDALTEISNPVLLLVKFKK